MAVEGNTHLPLDLVRGGDGLWSISIRARRGGK